MTMKTLLELEQKLTTPSADLINDVSQLDGDILILGMGGKMGPSLGVLAKKALTAAGKTNQVIGVSRFSDPGKKEKIHSTGIKTYSGDLLEDDFIKTLPKVKNVIYMAGHKFGTTGQESRTWAMNSYLPGRVADYFPLSNLVVFSTGNVYPLVDVHSKGATEETRPGPIGEYAQSCLGRERIFEYFSLKNQTRMLIFRLNYALDLRYGVLNDVARAVWNQQPVDLSMGYVNVIWQGDANAYAIQSLLHCKSPPAILNITGPETISVHWLAMKFGKLLDRAPIFKNEPGKTALLSNSSKAYQMFGAPKISLLEMINWTVDWIKSGGEDINKPTHFQERTGDF